jgi:hypothetical protein
MTFITYIAARMVFDNHYQRIFASVTSDRPLIDAL